MTDHGFRRVLKTKSIRSWREEKKIRIFYTHNIRLLRRTSTLYWYNCKKKFRQSPDGV